MSDNQKEKIGSRLKEIRSRLNKTQKEFANEAGIKQSQVSEIEKGVRNITDAILNKIEDTFKVSRKWLRYGEGDMFVNVNMHDDGPVNKASDVSVPYGIHSEVMTLRQLVDTQQMAIDLLRAEVARLSKLINGDDPNKSAAG